MNTLNQIESIQQVFPNLSRNQIRLDLDTAQKLIASEVNCLVTRASLSSISSNFAWTLPTNFTELVDLVFYDSDNNPKYLGDYSYKYEIELGKLFIYSLTSTPITGLSSEIASAYIHYRKLPETISTESTSMEVTEQFRDAIESYLLGKYFAKFPIDAIANGQVVKILNLQAAQLHKSEYEKLKIKLKRYINSQETTSGTVKNYQDAGASSLPRRPNDSVSGSTVSVAGLTDLYTKYAYYKITSGGSEGVKPSVLELGYTTISCTLSGDTMTLSSTGEFDEETIILINNWDSTWARTSASEIVITAPSGWSTIAFEIYERD